MYQLRKEYVISNEGFSIKKCQEWATIQNIMILHTVFPVCFEKETYHFQSLLKLFLKRKSFNLPGVTLVLHIETHTSNSLSVMFDIARKTG